MAAYEKGKTEVPEFVLESSEGRTIEIDAASMFKDKGFQAWFKAHRKKGLATWHVGRKLGEFSDVFLVWDHGECGDYDNCEPAMPKRCIDAIAAVCAKHDFHYGIIRLINI